MTWFVIVAGLLTIAALLLILWPLLRPAVRQNDSAGSVGLSIYRDQFTELERDLGTGTLGPGQYDAARAELERRMLDEVSAVAAPVTASHRSGRYLAIAIAIALPLVAGLLYWHLGQPQGIGAAQQAGKDPSSLTLDDFKAMTEKLAERMAKNPDDPTGWLMLGRAYKALQRFPEAAQALAEADKRKPNDPEILVEYGEALALTHGRHLAGAPLRLVERALEIDPDNQRALTLAGSAAFEARDYKHAIGYWERLLKQPGLDPELGQALQAGIAQARLLQGGQGQAQGQGKKSAGAPAPKVAASPATAANETVRGEVKLAEALHGRASPDDTVFIFARAAQGPPMPLAVVRKQVKDLPVRFTLDDSMAMAPNLKLSAFSEVVITARISKSGNAKAQSGDLQGASQAVKPGTSGVVISIDQVVQ
jgi:cytochrome c-type biogenesis protein CcmH